MSLKGLSKEQKQHALLGAVAAAVALVLIGFGIKVSLSSIAAAQLQLTELSGKIEFAERSVEMSRRQHAEFVSSIEQLSEFLDSIPPARNYYSWATEVIYKEARSVNFEIDAIDEMTLAATQDKTGNENAVVMESYSLRITAHGGYENIKQLLRRLSEDHPLVRVTGIEISAGSTPEIHEVQLFIEWPFNMAYIADAWESAGSGAIEPIHDDAILESAEPDSTNTPHPPPPRHQDKTQNLSVGPGEAHASVPLIRRHLSVHFANPTPGSPV